MNATSDTSSCTSLGVDLKKDAGDLVTNFISCIEGIVKDAHYDYNKTSRALQHVIETLEDMATTGSTNCSSDIYGCVKEVLWRFMESEFCIEISFFNENVGSRNNTLMTLFQMLSTNFTDIPIDIGSMALHGGSLTSQIATLQPSFVGCGAAAATKSLAKKAEDALAALGECLTKSTSTSS